MWYGREPQGLLLEDSYTTRTGVQEAKGVEHGCSYFVHMHTMHPSPPYTQVKADSSELLSSLQMNSHAITLFSPPFVRRVGDVQVLFVWRWTQG